MRAGQWFACCEPRPLGFLKCNYLSGDGRVMSKTFFVDTGRTPEGWNAEIKSIAASANQTYAEGYLAGLQDAASCADSFGYHWAAVEIRKL